MGSSPDQVASTWRPAFAAVLLAVMPLAMPAVFGAIRRRYGPERGYQAGFTIYWATVGPPYSQALL